MMADEEEILQKVREHRELADHYYQNMVESHRRGELGKSSELLWGTLNALAYAIGLIHNRQLTQHSQIRDFINELATAKKSKAMARGMIAAETIHANFFHGFMDKDAFEQHREDAEKLLNELATILNKELSRMSTSRR